MPIYEYRCTKKHTFEVVQRMTDDPIEVCEVCGSPVVKVMHSPAVHFKGSGFYTTDYGSRKRSREKEAAESKSKDSSSGSDSKSDSSSDSDSKSDKDSDSKSDKKSDSKSSSKSKAAAAD
jgi:putative FmdB family regulatory protein